MLLITFYHFTVVELELADVCDADRYKQPIMHAGTKMHAKGKEKEETLVRSCISFHSLFFIHVELIEIVTWTWVPYPQLVVLLSSSMS